MPYTATLDDLLTSLQRGETLLVPNGRAARELRSAYDAHQRAQGLGTWEPASVQAWSQWTNGLYNELIVDGVETRLLLNAAQQHSLWCEIVADDPPPGSLDSTDALAELAASAFQLAAAWNALSRLRTAANGPLGNADTRIFARWAEEFQRRCTAQKILPAALLEGSLSQHIAAKTAGSPAVLKLVGFSSFMPAQQTLLETLERRGTQIVRLNLAAAGEPALHASVLAEETADELRFAAHWLRQTLEIAQQKGQSPRIALLVPGLEAERAALEAELRATLAPELQSVAEDLSSTPWEFSTGVPLGSLGLIADALDILRWTTAALPLTRISALLLSPYLSLQDGREQAAQLDAAIRRKEKLLRPELTLSAFMALLETRNSTLTWPRNLATELTRSGDLARPRSYADWTELLRGLVQSTGWPNSELRELSATEFEATRTWDSVLDLVATLDFSGRRVPLSTALEVIELQVQKTQFAPPSTRAAVQIMTPAEAEGSAFDAVLFLHATDENWPARERTHPLLPWQLQKELAMPGTDPVRSAERARSFTNALLASTNTILFTSAKGDANGHLRVSPLLSELKIEPMQATALVKAASPDEPLTYEIVRDDAPLPPLPTAEVHGGATVLKLQAACGFLAFAQLRLNAKEPETSDLGLDARESGNLIHDVLHLFWREVKDSRTLASLTEEQRRERLGDCIDKTLAAEGRRLASAWDEAYIRMLRERLLRLLMPWLEVELARSPFAVLDTEREEFVTVGPLQLKVRMDRIDNILDEAGERLGEAYIDYKTGAAGSPAQWNGLRPDEPQLPLYTLISPEPEKVMGLAFAKLRVGKEMRYNGLQAQSGIFGGSAKKQVDLVGQIAEWKLTLVQLAEDFAAGRVDVDPKQYPQTCAHCGQRMLCRVNPADLRHTDAEDETEETDG